MLGSPIIGNSAGRTMTVPQIATCLKTLCHVHNTIVHTYMHIDMWTYVNVCGVCVYIYIHLHTYIHTYTCVCDTDIYIIYAYIIDI